VVVANDEGAGLIQRRTRAGRSHKRVAVAVTADPGAETHHGRQLVRVDRHAVHVPPGLGKLLIEIGQRLDQRFEVVVESADDLVANRWLVATHLVALPDAGDLRLD